jgi:membrane-associated phospholipid phosphatase
MIAVALAFALTASGSDKVDVRPDLDAIITGVGFAGLLVPALLSKEILPATCRICDGPDNSGLPGTGSRGSLNGVDAWFHDRMTGWLMSRGTAATVSDVVAYGLVPGGVLTGAFLATGPHASEGAGARAAIIVAESAAVSAAVVQGLKYVTARKRPFVRYGTGETSGTFRVDSEETRLGFPSGHTALAASASFALATTATIEESKAAPWFWAGAAVATVSTASLRIIAEKHYFTDVAAGALIGAASGVVFPLLHRRGGLLSSDSVSVGAQGPSFVLSGKF